MTKMEMNGRIVVPEDIRKAVGAKIGTRFIWKLTEDGGIHVVAKSKRPVADETPRPDSVDSLNGEGNAQDVS